MSVRIALGMAVGSTAWDEVIKPVYDVRNYRWIGCFVDGYSSRGMRTIDHCDPVANTAMLDEFSHHGCYINKLNPGTGRNL